MINTSRFKCSSNQTWKLLGPGCKD